MNLLCNTIICHIIQFTLSELNDLLLLGWGRHPPPPPEVCFSMASDTPFLFSPKGFQWTASILRRGKGHLSTLSTIYTLYYTVYIYVALLLDYTPAVTKLPKVVPSYSGNSLSFDNSISQLISIILSQYSRALFLGASSIIIKFVWPFTPPKISIFPSESYNIQNLKTFSPTYAWD